jgi:hypothetical protein
MHPCKPCIIRIAYRILAREPVAFLADTIHNGEQPARFAFPPLLLDV